MTYSVILKKKQKNIINHLYVAVKLTQVSTASDWLMQYSPSMSSPGRRELPWLPSTVSLYFTAVVFGSCYWQFIVIRLSTRVLDRQDSIAWSGKGENMVAACLPVSVFSTSTCSAWFCFALWKNWTKHDPTCYANNSPCHVSFVPCSHNKHKDAL